jgi:DNA-binding protein H-NS
MKKVNLESFSIDELWQLHQELNRLLSVRLTAEAQLRREIEPGNKAQIEPVPRRRRAYPAVNPKYRDPNAPNKTWSGRGKQPRWLTAALRTGHSIEEFLITN